MATLPADSARDFYVTAKGYAEAPKLIMSSPHYGGREPMMFLPTHLLIGFSLELYLKAWLSKSGKSNAELRRSPYGHSLENLYRDAKAAGLPFVRGLDEVIGVLHEPHSQFEYRYFDSSKSFDSLGLLHLSNVLGALDTEVDRFVGASASAGRAPGH